ncbi:hypothetical protein, partial [Lutimonas sp.]|uniref:hypothetical protein n=1 Tax=Lutimonas sp. TaxID=1872403 RepID=UPI003C75AF84
PTLYTSTPLDGLVDAASAESYPGYEFNKNVENLLNTKDLKLKNQIESILKEWIENHASLEGLFDTNEKVQMIQNHSENLSLLAALALKKINGEILSESEVSGLNDLLVNSKKEFGGTVLSVVPGLENILKSVE